jgi:hypothetical protein
MSKVIIDGSAKQILVKVGETSIDVQTDLYSYWKTWVTLSDNAKYEQAFRTFGGDPTVKGQKAPPYFFLMNGWRIIVDGQSVDFSYNLYTDEGDSPVITINEGVAQIKTSDAPLVELSSTTNVDYQALAEAVWSYTRD